MGIVYNHSTSLTQILKHLPRSQASIQPFSVSIAYNFF
jgi:hypothetical protein